MSTMNSEAEEVSLRKSQISMLLSAILMGSVGIIIGFLDAYSTYTIVLLRALGGTLFLTLFMIILHSFSKNFLKESFKMHWKPLLIIGITNVLVLYLYFENILISGLAIAVFLLYTNGIFVLLFIMIGKVEKVARINILSFLLAIVGVAIILEFWTGQAHVYGIILGILSGLALGIQVFYIKKIYIDRKKRISERKTKGDFDSFLAWWSMLFTIFIFLPLGAGDLVRLTWIDVGWVVILGFFPTALAFFLYNIGLKNDKGGNIILLAYIEPVVATILDAIFIQALSIYTIIGGSLILIANIIIIIFSRRKKKE